MTQKYVYFFGPQGTEGDATMKNSLGGKGATINVGADGRRMVTVGIPGTGMSYRTPLSGTIIVLLLAVVVIVGIAWLVQPELVRAALHWWQPRWF